MKTRAKVFILAKVATLAFLCVSSFTAFFTLAHRFHHAGQPILVAEVPIVKIFDCVMDCCRNDDVAFPEIVSALRALCLEHDVAANQNNTVKETCVNSSSILTAPSCLERPERPRTKTAEKLAKVAVHTTKKHVKKAAVKAQIQARVATRQIKAKTRQWTTTIGTSQFLDSALSAWYTLNNEFRVRLSQKAQVYARMQNNIRYDEHNILVGAGWQQRWGYGLTTDLQHYTGIDPIFLPKSYTRADISKMFGTLQVSAIAKRSAYQNLDLTRGAIGLTHHRNDKEWTYLELGLSNANAQSKASIELTQTGKIIQDQLYYRLTYAQYTEFELNTLDSLSSIYAGLTYYHGPAWRFDLGLTSENRDQGPDRLYLNVSISYSVRF